MGATSSSAKRNSEIITLTGDEHYFYPPTVLCESCSGKADPTLFLTVSSFIWKMAIVGLTAAI